MGPCVTYAARGSSVWSLSRPRSLGELGGAHRWGELTNGLVCVIFKTLLPCLVVSSSSLTSLRLGLCSLPPLGSPQRPRPCRVLRSSLLAWSF